MKRMLCFAMWLVVSGAGAQEGAAKPTNPPPSAQDALLLWVEDASRLDLARVAALHAAHPRVPLLARVPRGAADAELGLLGAGVQEVLHGPGELPAALDRARSRSVFFRCPSASC